MSTSYTNADLDNKEREIQKILDENHIRADLIEKGSGNIFATMSYEISGDWKHDHLRFNWLIQDLFDDIYNVKEEVIEDDGSDYYTSIHTIYFADKEDVGLLDSMKKLFQ